MKIDRLSAGILASIIFLALFVGIFVNQQFSEGRAIYLGDVPWTGGVIDLVDEESITFTALPDEGGKEIIIKTGIHPYDDEPQDYRLRIFKVDEQSFSYSLSGVIERDLLTDGEKELIYLNLDDAVADLEITYRFGRIRVKNLHYLPPEAAEVRMLVNDTEVGSVISLVKEDEFEAVIEASSSIPPQLEVNVGELSNIIEVIEENKTTALFSFTADEQAQLIITATVRGRESQAHYTLAVDDTLYLLDETNFPRQEITLTDDGAELEMTFLPSKELQPLALPCLIEGNLDVIFANSSIKRLYAYSGGEPLVWNQDGASDFNSLELFEGYFVEMDKLEEWKLKRECEVSGFLPMSGLPDFEAGTININEGWNIFSIPGVVERKLVDYTFNRDFRIFECKLGYICTEISHNSVLQPGKPYWIYSEDGFDINYRMG